MQDGVVVRLKYKPTYTFKENNRIFPSVQSLGARGREKRKEKGIEAHKNVS